MANRGLGTPQEGDATVIREEMSRLFALEERHRRLLARLFLTLALTVVVFAAGAILTWVFESGQKGGDIHGFGDAIFFTIVQLLTVSSQIKNPLTVAGSCLLYTSPSPRDRTRS